MVNLCDPSDPGSFSKARAHANAFFSQRNGDSQHTVHAIGHCHIDSGLLYKGVLQLLLLGSNIMQNVSLDAFF